MQKEEERSASLGKVLTGAVYSLYVGVVAYEKGDLMKIDLSKRRRRRNEGI